MSDSGYCPPATHPIFVAGTAINSSGSGADGAVGVRVRSIVGWLGDGVEFRDTREAKPGRDGEYADSQYLAGRTITFEGTIMGSSYADLQARKRTLAATWNAIVRAEGIVKLPKPEAAAPSFTHATSMTDFERVTARLTGGGIAFGDRYGTWGQRWQVSIRASDPVIYSDTTTSTDSITTGTAARTVTVDQAGTYETPPTLTVTGPTGTAWSVLEPTSGLRLSMSGLVLTSTGSVAFDVANRTATYTDTYEKVRTTRTDLVAMWMLDETSGTVADNEQGTAARDGTYSGSYVLNQAGPFTGIASTDFDGFTGKVAVPFQAALATTAFTFEGWALADSLGTRVIASCAQAAGGGWRLFTAAEGVLHLEMANSAGTDVVDMETAPGMVVQGEWFHFAITMASATSPAKLYVNGELVAVGENSGTYAAPTTQGFELAEGAASPVQNWNGKLAALAYYNTAVDAETIADWYSGAGDTATVGSAYEYLVAENSRWANLGTASSVYKLSSSGLNTGSKLNVSYRDARI